MMIVSLFCSDKAYFVDLFVRASNTPAIKMYEKVFNRVLHPSVYVDMCVWLFAIAKSRFCLLKMDGRTK